MSSINSMWRLLRVGSDRLFTLLWYSYRATPADACLEYAPPHLHHKTKMPPQYGKYYYIRTKANRGAVAMIVKMETLQRLVAYWLVVLCALWGIGFLYADGTEAGRKFHRGDLSDPVRGSAPYSTSLCSLPLAR